MTNMRAAVSVLASIAPKIRCYQNRREQNGPVVFTKLTCLRTS